MGVPNSLQLSRKASASIRLVCLFAIGIFLIVNLGILYQTSQQADIYLHPMRNAIGNEQDDVENATSGGRELCIF